MIRRLYIAPVLISLCWPQTALAAPDQTPEQLVRLNQAFNLWVRLDVERTTLLARMQRFGATIRATKARPAGPARDYKLRRLLADARSLAGSLSTMDRRIAQANKALQTARQALLKTLARLKHAQAQRAQRALRRTAAHRGDRPAVLRITKTRLDPLDGPREIEEKADLLRDSAGKIRKRLQEIDLVITQINRRQRLRSIARGVDRYNGVFGEDTSRRRISRTRPARTTWGSNDPGVPAEGLQNSNDMDAGNIAPTGASLGDDSHSRSPASSSYAVVLKDLLTPATLAALRKAGESADPRVRLQALRQVQAELRRAADRLRAREQRYRTRARTLRQREQQRRRR